MAENIKTNYLEKAYEDAIIYANTVIKKHHMTSQAYIKDDVFFQKSTIRIVIGMLTKLGFAIAILVCKGMLFQFMEGQIGDRFQTMFPEAFADQLLVGVCLALMIWGIIDLIKLRFAIRRKTDIKGISDLLDAITKEVDQASVYKTAIVESINTNTSLRIDHHNQWDLKLDNLNERLELIHKRNRIWNQRLTLFLSTISFIISLRLLPTFIADSLDRDYNFTSVLVIIISYTIINVILYEVFKYFMAWYKKDIRLVLIVLFFVFQACVIWKIKGSMAYTPIIDLEELYQVSRVPSFLQHVMEFLSQYVFNKGIVVMFLISYCSIMMLIKTDMEKLIQIKKQGYTVPMLAMPDRIISPKQITVSLLFPIALATIFILIAPFIMSYILMKEASLLTIVLYLVLGFVWFWINRYFKNEINRALHGKRPLWIKNSFLLSYILLTLSIVPSCGIGSVVLLLVQSLIAIIAYGFILSFFSIN